MPNQTKILIIYTGGTIGMITDVETGALKPFDFNQISEEVPELKKIPYQLETLFFKEPIDSSNVTPETWVKIAGLIEENYESYDGFVVLHGSDTMAYSASALSFMLRNLNKPVVFTGSQLPIGVIRTDGKENLVTAIEIAGAKKNGKPIVPEVSVYFEYKLYRGNRTTKLNAEHFEAFASFDYPILANAGIKIDYNENKILKSREAALQIYRNFDTNVAILTLFPGISQEFVRHFFNTPNLRGVVLQTFGSGNALSKQWFLDELLRAIRKKITILNITQCKMGEVIQGRYETSEGLEKIGVIGGGDMTIEAAITKMMVVLGEMTDSNQIKTALLRSFCGEITVA
ncbi:MAG: asparaginase [Flavobacteriales bacterium]|jgi:L-asparaginase|nr:asparaginase [Flavobacteriales bacterium]